MELNIGGKDYKLNFGIAFLNELDRCYPMKADNGQVEIPFYDGLNYVHLGLQQANPVAIANMIKSTTVTAKTKPSNDDIDEFLNNCDLIEVASSFFTNLRAVNMLKLKMKTLDNHYGMKITE